MTETTVITTIPADGAQEGVVQTAAAKEERPGLTIPIKTSEARADKMKLGLLRRVQKMQKDPENADIEDLYDYIGHFMTDNSERYLSREAYFAVLDELERGQLKELAEIVYDINEETEDAVVPKANETISTTRHT
jgi:hypothetical protein